MNFQNTNLNEEIEYRNFFIEQNFNFERKLTMESILTYKSSPEISSKPIQVPRPFSRDINPKGESIFVAREKNDRHHHVDQIGKYEIDKIQYIPPPAIEVIS